MASGRVESIRKDLHRIVIEGGRDPETHKRKRIVRTFHGGKTEAKEELQRLMQQMGIGVVLDADGLTVGQYLHQWLEGRRINLAPRTYESYRLHITKHIAPSLGFIPLAKLHPLQLDEFKGIKLRTLKPRTVDAILRTLNQALKRAVQLRLLVHNPVDAVEKPKYQSSKVQVLEVAQLHHLLNSSKHHPLYPVIYLAAFTGMRRGELLGLVWENVDLKKGDVHICQQWQFTQQGGLGLHPPKTEQAIRTIAITEDVIEVLSGLKKGSQFVFPSPKNGFPYHPHHITKAFIGLARDAGFPDFRFHDLRHTHASHLIAAGVPLPDVQQRLGHTLPSTTANIYTHPIESRRRVAADVFAQLMNQQDMAKALD